MQLLLKIRVDAIPQGEFMIQFEVMMVAAFFSYRVQRTWKINGTDLIEAEVSGLVDADQRW